MATRSFYVRIDFDNSSMGDLPTEKQLDSMLLHSTATEVFSDATRGCKVSMHREVDPEPNPVVSIEEISDALDHEKNR